MKVKEVVFADGSKEKMISGLLEALREYSPETFEHSSVTADCTILLARQAGLKDEEVELAGSCALLHDIGKTEIPIEILAKPDSLTDAEMEIMKTHSVKGYDILSQSELLEKEAMVARFHHEWHNGEGYPEGIEGSEIPYLSRLVAVADVFDALTSEREYRNPLPASAAMERIKNASGTQFDPAVIDIMCACQDQLERLKA